MRKPCLVLLCIVFVLIILLFIIVDPWLCLNIAAVIGLSLAALTILFLAIWIPWLILKGLWHVWKARRAAYWSSRTGITRTYVRDLKADIRNIRRMPIDEDERESAFEEARASFLRRLKEDLWQ